MAEPLISCILTTHNRFETAQDAAESVLRQTWADLELVVVDDVSTDGTAAAMQWKADGDNRLTVLSTDLPAHDEEGGKPSQVNRYAHNINQAWPHCQGDLICFLTDDAYYAPEAFASVVSYQAEHPDRQAYCVPRMTRWPDRGQEVFCPADGIVWRAHAVLDHCQVFVRRNLMETITTSYGQPWDEDPAFWQCGDARFFARFDREVGIHGIGGTEPLVFDMKDPKSMQRLAESGQGPAGGLPAPPDPYHDMP